ncbi:acyltransferase family protein [uncultured Prevotella sp.]|uniref:acyltransferase family protein n=1 Tax=uncultured Prevotella sp. TaxID=159272 RepID=UPI00266CA3F6|nr:acyltransferase family protein [uncultured Prevotella sp.]
MSKKRLYSLDMMKFMAALMITNSHFQPLYEGVNTTFATFGVQGNALFFFVAGYLLMMGLEKHKGVSFINWFKSKIRRLWPAVFIWVIVTNLIWDAPLTFDKLILGGDYWFLQTIVVYYALFYLLIKVLPAKCRFGGG